jgi:hypothetical protein
MLNDDSPFPLRPRDITGVNDDVVQAEIDKVYDRYFAPIGLTPDYLSFELSWQLDSGREPWARQVALMLAHDYIAQAIESGILVALPGRNGGLWRVADLSQTYLPCLTR